MFKQKKWIFIISVFLVVIISAISVIFILRGRSNQATPVTSPTPTSTSILSPTPASTPAPTPTPTATPTPADTPKETPTPISTATPEQQVSVMYFYSDSCYWCQQQAPVIAQLEQEGYSFTRMDVVANSNYWQDYNISGTPTFISSTGTRLEGYQEYNSLKTWIDQL